MTVDFPAFARAEKVATVKNQQKQKREERREKREEREERREKREKKREKKREEKVATEKNQQKQYRNISFVFFVLAVAVSKIRGRIFQGFRQGIRAGTTVLKPICLKTSGKRESIILKSL